MEPVVIRTALPDERARVLEVTRAAYEEYRKLMPPKGWEMYLRNIVQTVEGTDLERCIVATRGRHIVGSVYLFPADAQAYGAGPGVESYPEVRLLAVPQAERGNGVGGALMEDCKLRARNMGASWLGLHTTEVMQSARRKYERMGFVRVPETDFRPAPNWVVMGFKLDLTR
jgi:predicted N-acetyltransferase YhbS